MITSGNTKALVYWANKIKLTGLEPKIKDIMRPKSKTVPQEKRNTPFFVIIGFSGQSSVIVYAAANGAVMAEEMPAAKRPTKKIF